MNSVKYMYRDLTNLSYIEGCDNSINNFLSSIDPKNQIKEMINIQLKVKFKLKIK